MSRAYLGGNLEALADKSSKNFIPAWLVDCTALKIEREIPSHRISSCRTPFPPEFVDNGVAHHSQEGVHKDGPEIWDTTRFAVALEGDPMICSKGAKWQVFQSFVRL